MSMPHFLLLSCVGLFISAQAQDCQRPVGGSNMDLSDADILKTTFPDGTKVGFVCDRGYIRAGGTPTITCTAGSWSRLTLTCEKKTCGAVEDLLNGQVSYIPGNEFGDKVIFTCNTGYRLVGRNERICGDQGWMGRNPECEAVSCDPPQKIPNGIFRPENSEYKYGNAVTYQCENGLTMVGLPTLTCEENGQFQPDPPVCKSVECPEPEITDGYVAGGSRPPHGYKATVTIACKPGYYLKGQANIVCGIDGNWSPELPKCEAVTCPPPPSVTNGSFSPKKQIYKISEVVEYSCDKDYEMKGQKTVSCSEAGTFKPAPPTCTQKQTTPRPTTTTTTSIATPPKTGPEGGAPDEKVPVGTIVGGVLGGVCGVGVVCGIAYIIYKALTSKESAAGKKAKEDEEAVCLSSTRKNVDQASGGTRMEMKD